MFFEDVPAIGTPAQILAEYGIDRSRFPQVLAYPENDTIRPLMPAPVNLNAPFATGISSIRLPIDVTASIVRAVPRVDMTNGLRPLPIVNGVVDRSNVHNVTHGIDLQIDHTGLPCNRIRWLQTVRKRHNPDRQAPLDFVDVGGNNEPWYFAGQFPDPLRFDDTPCGPAATSAATGLEFRATVSLAVWTMDRITLILGYTYGFRIVPGITTAAVRWHPHPRPATTAEFSEQIRVLEAGINQLRRPTGGRLLYNPVPAAGSVNEGILFGRY